MSSGTTNHLLKVHNYESTDFRWHSLRSLAIKYVAGKSILDAGCGTAHMTMELLHQGYDVTAIDNSPELIECAQEIISSNNYTADLQVLDLVNAKVLGKDRFDTILCLDVLEHIPDDVLAIKNLCYVLKNNGRLIIAVPALGSLYGLRDKNIGHYRRYDNKQLTNTLIACGLDIEKLRYWNFLGLLPTLFYEKLLHRKIYEGMRYSRISFFSNLLNSLLDRWFCCIENNVSFPVGMTLIAVCRKKQ